MRHLLLAALALAPAACFSPTYNNAACSPEGECPDGFTCVADVCQPNGGDDDDDDDDDGGPPIDASDEPDAPVFDAMPIQFPAECQYLEQSDGGNDNGGEGTGQTVPDLGSGPLIICGSFAPRVPTGGIVDTDQFDVLTTGDVPLIARVSLLGPNNYASVVVQTGGGQAGDRPGVLVGDHAVDIGTSSGGVATVAVQASNPGVTAETGYMLRIEVDDPMARCPGAPAQTYSEVLDTILNGDTGNDYVNPSFTGNGAFSGDPNDMPEPTGLTIAPLSKSRLQGTNVNKAQLPDQYKDRDAFLITTGPNTNEIDLVHLWNDLPEGTDDADLDYFFYDPETLVPVSWGIRVGFNVFEGAMFAVEPSTEYLVMSASFMDAVADKPYTIDLCGNSYVP